MEKVRASRRKFHFLYKTTCQITNRYYIGVHSTDNINDGYLGSGIQIWRSIKKYGKEVHSREILQMLDSRLELLHAESIIVTKELINTDKLCMNLIEGGSANNREFGFTDEVRAKLSKASKNYVRTKEWYEKTVATRLKNDSYKHTPETCEKIRKALTGKTLSEEHKRKISEGGTGQIRSEETCEKISKALIGKMKGVPKAPFSEQHRESIRQARIGKKHSEEAKANMRKSKDMSANKRACTIDGITIFSSVKDMIAALGSGRNSRRSPNFRYVL